MSLKYIFIATLIGSAAMAADNSNWADRFTLGGDFRFRHDYVTKDKVPDRHREMFRLRYGTQVKVNDSTKVRVRLSTSDSTGNPIGNNAQMNNNADKKVVFFDQAMVEWKPNEIYTLGLGKQENPYRILSPSQLIYDADYTPEGLSLAVDVKRGELPVFVRVGIFALAERDQSNTAPTNSSGPDSFLMADLVGFRLSFPHDMEVTVAGGYHDFSFLRGNSALKGGFSGNSNDGTFYDKAYEVYELLSEWKMKRNNMAFSVFGDFLNNAATGDHQHAMLAGASAQMLDSKGKAQLSVTYSYRAVQKDATVSAINDSDFASGQDGSNGHTIIVGYPLNENCSVQATYMTAGVDNDGAPYRTDHGILDLLVNF